MLNKSIIDQVVKDQARGLPAKNRIERDAILPENTSRIVIVSGIRRCGKSTLLKSLLMKKNEAVYINFEDPRLVNFEVTDFIRLEELSAEQGKFSLLLDEIQNVPQWEIYARSAHERGIKLTLTGSNASLFSRELGTKLTGRYLQVELFPFNYGEFLRFFSLERSEGSFEQYFEFGGFPEFLAEKDEVYLRVLLRDIIARDIALRRNISNENQLLRLAVHLFSNIGKNFSYNKISKLLEIKSVRTVIDYCDYLRDSYLMEYVPMYSASIKKQIANAKKAYAIDTAFARASSLSFSQDLGRRLENIVYLKLRQSGHSIYYYRSQDSECDFLVKKNEVISSLVQVCWELNLDNQERELRGIRNAMAETGADDGVIVTFNQDDMLEGIPVVPAWKWV
jgi:predicted AAA+ superfamily ATPase